MIRQFITFSYGSWVSAAISFFTTPVITLLILPEEFGKAAMFTLAMNLAHQIGLLGMDQSFMRMYHEKPAEERSVLARRCFTFSIGVTALIICGMIPFRLQISTMLFDKTDFGAILMLAACIMLAVINRFASSVVRMSKKGHVLSVSQIISVIVNLAIIIGYAKYVAATFHAIVWGTVGALISSIAVLFFSEITFWLGNFNKKTLTRADQKQIFEYGLPLVPVLAISFIFQGMDKIALRAYSTLDEVGIYATATKFVFLLTIIQTTFYLFWAPVAFERYEKDRTDSRFFENMFKYMAAAVLLAGCALLLAKDVIVLLLAESYRGAVYIMPFLLIAPMMYILGDVAGIGIGLKKKTYFYIVVVAVGAIVNFTGNYFLIPIIGAKGAAVSTGIAYIVYFIIRTSIGTRLFPAKYPMARFLCGFLVIVGFMYLNTFHVVLWWYNVIPALITVMLYRSTIYEILRRKA